MRQGNRRVALAVGLALCAGTMLPARAVQEGDTTTVYVTGTLVDAPQCTVNGNDKIDVDFGDDMITRLVDGVNYKTPLIYALSCTSLAQQGLTLTINGSAASFGTGLLKTDKAGLGIRLYNGSTALIPGTPVTFTYGSPPTLYAVPVAQDNTTLTAGAFSGTGTMVFAYQ